MKFGVFYEHQLPRPWTEKSEYRVDAKLARADRTRRPARVRLCLGSRASLLGGVFALLCARGVSRRCEPTNAKYPSWPRHHSANYKPAASGRRAGRHTRFNFWWTGRVGMGEGAGPAELHPFDIRVRDKRDRWEEAVQAIIPMFTETNWEWHGQYYDFPARNVVPKPFQKPHPPLWVACSNIRTIAEAGQWGMGALGFSFVSPEAATAWVNKYYNMLLHHPRRLAQYPVNPQVAIVNGFMCAETDEEALEKAAGWTFFIFALSYYGRKGVDAPGSGNLWQEYQAWRQTDKAQAALKNGLIGSPETIRKRLRQFQAAHVDQVILLNQAGKTSHQDICDSLKLFAEQVMPEFHADQGAHESWKQQVLSGAIELEDLDTSTYDLYSHQNEDIVRLSPAELKARMQAKEAAAGDD